MKIFITGILGYIGREICEEYKNSSHEIYGIDSNFIPDKVKWLRDNNIKYYNKDLFNCKELIEKADIIYHLASETLVPITKDQSTPEIDKKINNIGINGTREIIKNSSENVKIIFASSHTVFEGLINEVHNIEESYTPQPILAYSSSKYQSELDLINSDKNYIICRLASVYGYGACMRWKILPNLFSKMTALNQDLKVFGGQNYKPLVGINDVAKALKFLAESIYNRDTFNICNENLTVMDIAKICKKYNEKINIFETDDSVPNKGYTLSNKKLTSFGFKFNQNLDEEIKKMINSWSINA